MAKQHDFGLLTKSFGDIATQINLIANLPPVHDRLQSQTRHDQLVTGLQALESRNETIMQSIQALHTHVNAMDETLQGLTTNRVNGMNETVEGLNNR